MKRTIIIIIILLLGLGILSYPAISDYFYEKNSSTTVTNYAESVAGLDKTTRDREWKAAEEYNENLTGDPVHDPFLEGTGMAMPETYTEVLNFSGIMGSVEIPKIGVTLPIYHGTSESALESGAGHLEGSTLPIGGTSRHAVITGHTGLTRARMFTDLVDLEVGDTFYLHVMDEVLAYKVDQIKVIEPNMTDDLKRVAGKDYCTLLTCTPYGVNNMRLLVRGIRVDYSPEAKAAIAPIASSTDRMLLYAATITIVVMATLIVVAWILAKKRRRKEEDEYEARLASEIEAEIDAELEIALSPAQFEAMLEGHFRRQPVAEVATEVAVVAAAEVAAVPEVAVVAAAVPAPVAVPAVATVVVPEIVPQSVAVPAVATVVVPVVVPEAATVAVAVTEADIVPEPVARRKVAQSAAQSAAAKPVAQPAASPAAKPEAKPVDPPYQLLVSPNQGKPALVISICLGTR